MKNIKQSRHIGSRAERIALDYLQKQGLTLRQVNFYTRMGEIDIVMEEGEYIVFVEVRYRRQIGYGNSAESITYGKQQRIWRTAEYYLQKHQLLEKRPCRFDVVAMHGPYSDIEIDWIKDAFQA